MGAALWLRGLPLAGEEVAAGPCALRRVAGSCGYSARGWDVRDAFWLVPYNASSLLAKCPSTSERTGYGTRQAFDRSSEVPRGAWTKSDHLCASSSITHHHCT